jgi:hypothetical protein
MQSSVAGCSAKQIGEAPLWSGRPGTPGEIPSRPIRTTPCAKGAFARWAPVRPQEFGAPRAKSIEATYPQGDGQGRPHGYNRRRNVSLSRSDHGTQLRRAVIADTVGTTIEWYDFLLYSTVTGLIFGKLYFPSLIPWLAMLEAFAICTVGFIARPIGAAIFGHYGDRIGR